MDKWGSMQNFLNDFSELMRNPKQYSMQKMGIPENIADDPDAIIQQLMNSGKITQDQYNEAYNAAMKIQSNPLFSRFMKR